MDMGEDRLFKEIADIMKRNSEFLNLNARQFCEEILELLNDPINFMEDLCNLFHITSEGQNLDRLRSLFVRDAMLVYLHNILFPSVFSLYINVLLGNFPAFLRDLRFMIESLAKCYVVDAKYPEKGVLEKMKLISKWRSERRIVRALDSELNTDSRATKLWHKLSEETHLSGYVKRVIENIEVVGMPPDWALTPAPWRELRGEDIDEILDPKRGFHIFLCEFREILSIAWKNYLSKLEIERKKRSKNEASI